MLISITSLDRCKNTFKEISSRIITFGMRNGRFGIILNYSYGNNFVTLLTLDRESGEKQSEMFSDFSCGTLFTVQCMTCALYASALHEYFAEPAKMPCTNNIK